MKHTLFCFLTIAALLCFNTAFAQQQQEEKSPEEMAIEEALRLERELKLSSTQAFYVDFILRHNFELMKADIDNLRERGSQDVKSYQTVSDKWITKIADALKPVLQEQQYIRYLKLIGRGKEYKKGKDGIYYLKEKKKKDKE